MAHRGIGILNADPRKRKSPTGGSMHAGQQKDSSPIQVGNTDTGGIGFANRTAFQTGNENQRQQSWEQAMQGGKAGKLGRDTPYSRMTEAEREEHKVKNMGIAPTKVDDYSDWGVARKGAADKAHAEGKMSMQDKQAQLVIDTREADKYKYEVTDRNRAAAAHVSANQGIINKFKRNITPSRTFQTSRMSAYKPSVSTGLRGRSGGGGGGKLGGSGASKLEALGRRDNLHLGPGSFTDPERYGSPEEQRQATLAKDGWTPEQISDFGTNYVPFDALRTQNALPGVQDLTKAEAAAQYGGAGKANAYSMALISGTVMDPGFRNAAYGEGLGLEKTKTTLSYKSGGQKGGGPGGVGNVLPILLDRQLGGTGF